MSPGAHASSLPNWEKIFLSERFKCNTVIQMTTLSFKVSIEEAQAIRERARQERMTVSEFLRRQAAAPMRRQGQVNLRECPLTHVKIFDTVEDLSPLTVEATRKILADFP